MTPSTAFGLLERPRANGSRWIVDHATPLSWSRQGPPRRTLPEREPHIGDEPTLRELTGQAASVLRRHLIGRVSAPVALPPRLPVARRPVRAVALVAMIIVASVWLAWAAWGAAMDYRVRVTGPTSPDVRVLEVNLEAQDQKAKLERRASKPTTGPARTSAPVREGGGAKGVSVDGPILGAAVALSILMLGGGAAAAVWRRSVRAMPASESADVAPADQWEETEQDKGTDPNETPAGEFSDDTEPPASDGDGDGDGDGEDPTPGRAIGPNAAGSVTAGSDGTPVDGVAAPAASTRASAEPATADASVAGPAVTAPQPGVGRAQAHGDAASDGSLIAAPAGEAPGIERVVGADSWVYAERIFEKRRSPRVPVQLSAVLRWRGGERTVGISELSEGGLRLRVEGPLPLTDPVRGLREREPVRLQIGTSHGPLVVGGQIAWRNSATGGVDAGVQFMSLPDDVTTVLHAVLRHASEAADIRAS